VSSDKRWRLVVGSDDAGMTYKDLIVADLRKDPRVAEVVDLGVGADEHTPYPDIGLTAAERVAAGDADRAVLVCGTGIGMAVSANKVPGVRATTAHDSYSAERSVLSNDCQVLALGQRVIGAELARRLVDEWLDYEFDPGSASHDKVARITAYEQAGSDPDTA